MSDQLKPCPRGGNRLTHGHTKTRTYSPTYQSWQSMLARCRYKNRHNSGRYIGRGILVCERWCDFASFLADMGERPAGLTLERNDNSIGYQPGNCRWATPTEQARNTRRTRLTFETATQIARKMLAGGSPAKIAKEFGISESLPREIMRGRCWKDALATAKGELQ